MFGKLIYTLTIPIVALASLKSLNPERMRTPLHYLYKNIKFEGKEVELKAPTFNLNHDQLRRNGKRVKIDAQEFEWEKELSQSVFRIRGSQGKSFGSGFLVSRNTIITNFHVYKTKMDEVNGCGQFKVKLNPPHQKQKFKCESVLICNKELDYCLVKLKNKKGLILEDLVKPLPWTDQIAEGEDEEVWHLGNPRNFGIMASSGKGLIIKDNRINHFAPLWPGSSGGPLLNRQGEVIGINYRQTVLNFSKDSTNFAIPIRRIKEHILKSLSPENLSQLNLQ